MRVVGWTWWEDPRYPDNDLCDSLFDTHRQAVVAELRRRGYHFSGYYHQGGEHGVPVLDDGNCLRVSFRTWGQIMADAYPEEVAQVKSAYIVWAWCSPCEPGDMIIPRREDYPGYEFWDSVDSRNGLREDEGL